MSTYLPPIDTPQATYRLQVLRSDPEGGVAPHWVEYEIPWVVTMTLIEALEWLWDQGEYVAFRANCREFTCGSCGMIADGKPVLACDTPLRDGMRIEPLARYTTVKDLVTDTSPVREKWRELELWPHLRDQPPITHLPPRTMEQWHRAYSRCIECNLCLDVCPTSESDASAFPGPMWMLQMGRQSAHPFDGVDRVAQAEQNGLDRCVSCFECANVCPMQLSPVGEVHAFRRRSFLKTLRRAFARSGGNA